MGGLDAIEHPKQMNDKLLRRDVEGIISSITPPFLPFTGLSGGITVGKHVSEHV